MGNELADIAGKLGMVQHKVAYWQFEQPGSSLMQYYGVVADLFQKGSKFSLIKKTKKDEFYFFTSQAPSSKSNNRKHLNYFCCHHATPQ